MAHESRSHTSVRGFTVDPIPASSVPHHQYERVGSTGTLVRRADGAAATNAPSPSVSRGRPAWPFMSTLGQTTPTP